MLTPSQPFPKSYGGALLYIKRWPWFCCQGPSTLEKQCWPDTALFLKVEMKPLSVLMSKTFGFSDVLHIKVDKQTVGWIYSKMWPADVSVFKWGHRLFFTDVYLWLPLPVWRCPVVRSMLEVKSFPSWDRNAQKLIRTSDRGFLGKDGLSLPILTFLKVSMNRLNVAYNLRLCSPLDKYISVSVYVRTNDVWTLHTIIITAISESCLSLALHCDSAVNGLYEPFVKSPSYWGAAVCHCSVWLTVSQPNTLTWHLSVP